MSFNLQLTGMRALVTGGARGVGAAVVQALVDAGVRVVAATRSLPSRAVENVRYIAGGPFDGRGRTPCRADLIAFLASPRAASLP